MIGVELVNYPFVDFLTIGDDLCNVRMRRRRCWPKRRRMMT